MFRTLLVHPIFIAVVSSVLSAARVDYEAFKSWQTPHSALAYDWGIAVWRWFQAAIIGGVTGAGAWAVANGYVAPGAAMMFVGLTLYAKRGRRAGAVVLLGTVILASTACGGSLAHINQATAESVARAISVTEQTRCTQTAAPCLSEEQFRAANRALYKVSVAGREFTEIQIAGRATTKDVVTFLATVAETTSDLSKAFPDGPVGDALKELIELQQQLSKFIGR